MTAAMMLMDFTLKKVALMVHGTGIVLQTFAMECVTIRVGVGVQGAAAQTVVQRR